MTNKFFLFLAPATALGLVACGGSSGGGGNSTNLDSTESVAKQVSSLVSATTNVTADGSTRRKTHNGCDSGEQSDFQENGVDVDSPYTDQPFDLSGQRFENCRFNQDENNYFIIDGESAGGQLSENNDFIEYFRFGDGNSPLSYTLHSEEGGNSSDFTFNFDLVLHGRESSSNDFDGELFMIYDGEFGSSGFVSDFRFRLGSANTPGSRFVVSESANGTTIDGDYEIRLDDAIDSQLQCSAQANIATNDPLVMNDSTTLYSEGQMTFTAGGQQASVTFHSDDTVTIDTASGSERISQQELLSRGQECSGVFAAGFGFF